MGLLGTTAACGNATFTVINVHLCGASCTTQIVKEKVMAAEDGRGRFKTMSDQPLRIADRTKKAALKS